MNGFGRRGGTAEQPQASRGAGSLFGDLSDRLAAVFSTDAHSQSAGRRDDDAEPSGDLDWTFPEDQVLPPFPIAKQGYDCHAVDQHLADLEAALYETQRELDELRQQIPSRSVIAGEIDRIGEQTSAILITAHEKASEMASVAQMEAQACIADATSYAAALREEAKLERRRAQNETASLRRERTRLMQDIRRTAAALSSLAADEASGSKAK